MGGIGLRVVVSSITDPKVSLSGSLKKINSESSPWKKAEMSKEFLNACLEALRLSEHQSKRNPERSSCLTKNMVTCILAPPILAPVRGLLSISICLDGPKKASQL